MAEQEKCWHYAMGSREVGPLTWQELRALAVKGGIARQTLVWKTGMETWVSAVRVQGLFEDAPVLVRPVAYAHQDELDEQIGERARQFAVAMFVALVVELVAAAVLILERFPPSPKFAVPTPLALLADLGALAALPMGVFALIYMPYRWRVIGRLGRNHRLLARVGGFGLIVMLAGLAMFWILK
jgi:hypothetical protein